MSKHVDRLGTMHLLISARHNPFKSGKVVVSAHFEGDEHATLPEVLRDEFVSPVRTVPQEVYRAAEKVWCHAKKGSWIMVEFTEHIVFPLHYALQQGYCELVNWALQASVDGKTWVDLGVTTPAEPLT